jgi:hypothetical protein
MAAAFANENSCLLIVFAVLRTLNLKSMSIPTDEPLPIPA